MKFSMRCSNPYPYLRCIFEACSLHRNRQNCSKVVPTHGRKCICRGFLAHGPKRTDAHIGSIGRSPLVWEQSLLNTPSRRRTPKPVHKLLANIQRLNPCTSRNPNTQIEREGESRRKREQKRENEKSEKRGERHKRKREEGERERDTERERERHRERERDTERERQRERGKISGWLLVAGCGLRVAGCGLRVAGLRVLGCGLRRRPRRRRRRRRCCCCWTHPFREKDKKNEPSTATHKQGPLKMVRAGGR